MGLTTNESSYIQAVSNRWDAALPSHVEVLTTGVDFDQPSVIYLSEDAAVTFIAWDDTASVTMALAAGYQPIRMKQVISVSTGTAHRLY
jgi:hypothetical protein